VTAPTPSAARRFFERRCREHASIKRAVGEKAYLRSDLRFIGTMMPEIRQAARDFAQEHPELTRTELRRIVDELWSTDVFELRSCGIALLSRCAKLLDERDLPWLIGLIRRSKTWAHVDWLAGEVIASVVGESRSALKRLPAWARDKDFWVRRTALLAQLPQLRHDRGDFELFARMAGACSVSASSSSVRRSAGCCARWARDARS
jgi:3-methyladenine DNA glycosylase AlkD